MSSFEPYAPAREPSAGKPIHEVYSENQFPIEFRRGRRHGLVLAACIIGGGMFVLFGFLMFLLHLFLIDGNNQIALHLSSTMPIILGVFTLINAYHLVQSPEYVRLWPQGVEIQGRGSIDWNRIDQVAVDEVVGGQRKVVRLIDSGGKTIQTISGVENFDQLVSAMRSAIRPLDAAEQPTKPQASQVKRGRKRAAGFAAFGLMCVFGFVFMAIEANWSRHRTQRMATNSAIGKGSVVQRKVAPNGKTKRLHVEIVDDHGGKETHNFEVEDWLYESTQVGDSIEVRLDPDDARIAELPQGQVTSDEFMDTFAGSLMIAVGMAIMALMFFGTAAMAWKGYDLKVESGKFRLVPIGT